MINVYIGTLSRLTDREVDVRYKDTQATDVSECLNNDFIMNKHVRVHNASALCGLII